MDREQIEALKWESSGRLVYRPHSSIAIIGCVNEAQAVRVISEHNLDLDSIVAGMREEPAQESATMSDEIRRQRQNGPRSGYSSTDSDVLKEKSAQESATTAGFFAANPQDATKIQNSVPDLKGFNVSIKRVADGTTQEATNSKQLVERLSLAEQERDKLKNAAKCSECSAPCTDSDLVGNGMIQDGLGEWPKYWCKNCINRHLAEDENAVLREQVERMAPYLAHDGAKECMGDPCICGLDALLAARCDDKH